MEEIEIVSLIVQILQLLTYVRKKGLLGRDGDEEEEESSKKQRSEE